MRATTVYLEDEEAERLTELSARTGKPEAELIRERVQRVLGEAPLHRRHGASADQSPAGSKHEFDENGTDEQSEVPERAFHSMGAGEYTDDASPLLDQPPKHRLRSAGVGACDGDAPPHWTSDELYAKVFRERLADERDADR